MNKPSDAKQLRDLQVQHRVPPLAAADMLRGRSRVGAPVAVDARPTAGDPMGAADRCPACHLPARYCQCHEGQ